MNQEGSKYPLWKTGTSAHVLPKFDYFEKRRDWTHNW